MEYVKIQFQKLHDLSCEIFKKIGFTPSESKIITDVLLTSDLFGIESHGVQRLILYYKTIKNGRIHMGARWEIVHETPISAVIDNHFGVGQLVGHHAMKLAIEKAKTSGVGMISVRNSNHYGIAGYYAKMACDQGLIGISTTNSEAIMVPTYGSKAMLGSNPIAFAMPAEPTDFLFDVSTTVVTRGKIEVYKKKGLQLPDGWAVDHFGHPNIDAEEILRGINERSGGGILPLGGAIERTGSHKGYGFGIISEIFASILSCGLTSNHTHIESLGGTCHSFIALDPGLFGDPKKIKEHFSVFLQELRDASLADGSTRIYTHGEKEKEASQRIMAEGVPVNINTLLEIKEICSEYQIDIGAYINPKNGP